MRKQIAGNWPLYGVWFIILLSTIAITLFYNIESSSFYGIAETREIVVNFEGAVEIKRISVTEGQSVEKGAILVELTSPDLMLKINHISHQLEQLKAQKGVDKSEVLSRLRQLKAEKVAKENELENQIVQLENQYTINKSLLSGLKSISKNNEVQDYNNNSPIQLKIRNLKKELSLSVNPLIIQIELLNKTLANSENPIEIQVERLENELNILREEKTKLNIYAQISGIIGSVNFKPGAKVTPFAPILTLHTKTPSFVKGYIYENVYSPIAMGECVNVVSLAAAETVIKGCVVGIGARIVEYPVRLRKHPDMQVWGREVVIRIPVNNKFILGEKVMIAASEKKQGFAYKLKKLLKISESIAGGTRTDTIISNHPVILPVVPLETKGIEASAALYLKDIDKYMLLSDDTPDNSPLVFIMDLNGRVIKETLIEGSDKINDMESVAEGQNGVLYIASSLGAGKKGKVKKSGKRLISVRRSGDTFSLIGMVDLHSLLKESALKESEAEWAGFILDGIAGKSLDIEGLFYRDGALFLGFKAPLLNGQSMILKISDIDNVIKNKNKTCQISLWQSVQLKGQEVISGMLYINDILYITGTPLKKKAGTRSGSLWKFDEKTGVVIRLIHFENFQPEGIAAGKNKDTLMICFDQGRNKKSNYCNIRVK